MSILNYLKKRQIETKTKNIVYCFQGKSKTLVFNKSTTTTQRNLCIGKSFWRIVLNIFHCQVFHFLLGYITPMLLLQYLLQYTPFPSHSNTSPLFIPIQPLPFSFQYTPSPLYSNTPPSPLHSNTPPSPLHSNTSPSPFHSNTPPSPLYSNTLPSPLHSNTPPSLFILIHPLPFSFQYIPFPFLFERFKKWKERKRKLTFISSL